MLDTKNVNLAIIGLGYVGLPLAVAFGKRHQTLGFDINADRVLELANGRDHTREVSADELKETPNLTFTSNADELAGRNVFIVAVPTPINAHKQPDLTPLIESSKTVGKALSSGNVVIYESTVFPGATEDICVPILEAESGLRFNEDFFVGYSPERINPGDHTHRLANIKKITSGSTPEAADFVNELYSTVVTVGTHKASSIRVAEAAKIIENTQRDVNIALVNELAMLFERLGLDTQEVLEAAATKWNFQPFQPGLVGGHCIGVDPYYLTYKAMEVDHHPEMILAGRRINDHMGVWVAEQIVKQLVRRRIHVNGSYVLILGLTFKENCPDLRNTRVIDVIQELEHYGAQVDCYDPWADAEIARKEYGVTLLDHLKENTYDAIILAVPHQEFLDWGIDKLRGLGQENSLIYDLKGILPKDQVEARL